VDASSSLSSAAAAASSSSSSHTAAASFSAARPASAYANGVEQSGDGMEDGEEEYMQTLPYYRSCDMKVTHKIRTQTELHRIRHWAPSTRVCRTTAGSGCGSDMLIPAADDSSGDGSLSQSSWYVGRNIAAAKGPEPDVRLYDLSPHSNNHQQHQRRKSRIEADASEAETNHGNGSGSGKRGRRGRGGRSMHCTTDDALSSPPPPVGRRPSSSSGPSSSSSSTSCSVSNDATLLTLIGASSGGWAIDWNMHPQQSHEGLLVSGDEDGTICMWNIRDADDIMSSATATAAMPASASALNSLDGTPVTTLIPATSPNPLTHTNLSSSVRSSRGGRSSSSAAASNGTANGPTSSNNPKQRSIHHPKHGYRPTLHARQCWSHAHGCGSLSAINDIAWIRARDGCANSFLSVGDDGLIRRWDQRTPTKEGPTVQWMAHQTEVSSISTSPFDANWVLTGGKDKVVKLWDLRKPKSAEPLHTFIGHGGEIVQVSWAPFDSNGKGTVFASASKDHCVFIWDHSLSNSSSHFSKQDLLESGPSELIFVHRAHTEDVEEFCWHPRVPWLMASAGDENVVQVWQIAEALQACSIADEEESQTQQQQQEEEMLNKMLEVLQPKKRKDPKRSRRGRHPTLNLDALSSVFSSTPMPSSVEKQAASMLDHPSTAGLAESIHKYGEGLYKKLSKIRIPKKVQRYAALSPSSSSSSSSSETSSSSSSSSEDDSDSDNSSSGNDSHNSDGSSSSSSSSSSEDEPLISSSRARELRANTKTATIRKRSEFMQISSPTSNGHATGAVMSPPSSASRRKRKRGLDQSSSSGGVGTTSCSHDHGTPAACNGVDKRDVSASHDQTLKHEVQELLNIAERVTHVIERMQLTDASDVEVVQQFKRQRTVVEEMIGTRKSTGARSTKTNTMEYATNGTSPHAASSFSTNDHCVSSVSNSSSKPSAEVSVSASIQLSAKASAMLNGTTSRQTNVTSTSFKRPDIVDLSEEPTTMESDVPNFGRRPRDASTSASKAAQTHASNHTHAPVLQASMPLSPSLLSPSSSQHHSIVPRQPPPPLRSAQPGVQTAAASTQHPCRSARPNVSIVGSVTRRGGW